MIKYLPTPVRERLILIVTKAIKGNDLEPIKNELMTWIGNRINPDKDTPEETKRVLRKLERASKRLRESL